MQERELPEEKSKLMPWRRNYIGVNEKKNDRFLLRDKNKKYFKLQQQFGKEKIIHGNRGWKESMV